MGVIFTLNSLPSISLYLICTCSKAVIGFNRALVSIHWWLYYHYSNDILNIVGSSQAIHYLSVLIMTASITFDESWLSNFNIDIYIRISFYSRINYWNERQKHPQFTYQMPIETTLHSRMHQATHTQLERSYHKKKKKKKETWTDWQWNY